MNDTLISKYVSTKIAALSFISIVLVLYAHSYMPNVGDVSRVNWVQSFFSGGVCARIAIPFFFMISGFLFFVTVDNSISRVFTKIQKRLRSLLIPYLLWCILTLLLFIVLNLFVWTSQFVNLKIFAVYDEMGFWGTLKLVFWGDPMPLAFQFWFVRNLLVVIFTTPLIFLMIKYVPSPLIFVSLLFAIAFSDNASFLLSFSYFILGAIFSEHKKLLAPKVGRSPLFLSVMLFLIFLTDTILLVSGYIPVFVHNIFALVGVFAVWLMYDVVYIYVPRGFKEKIKPLLNYTFFVFAFHEPILNVLKKITHRFFNGDFAVLLCYFFNPIVILLISLFIAVFLKKKMFYIYSILTGGRD